MATMKEVAATANIATQVALRQTLVELKDWLDQNQAHNEGELKKVSDRLSTLIGQNTDGTKVDVTKAIDTFNEIRDFLEGIQDTTLDSLLKNVNKAVSDEKTRAEAAESALAARVKTLEDVETMTAAQATALFHDVFDPADENDEGE